MSDISESKEPQKSSAEILSELFSSFNTNPPNLDEEIPIKKHKKSKKKHKHKERKRKKKSKHKRNSSNSDNDDAEDSTDDEDNAVNEYRHKHKSKKKKYNDIDLSIVKKERIDESNDTKQVLLDTARIKTESSNSENKNNDGDSGISSKIKIKEEKTSEPKVAKNGSESKLKEREIVTDKTSTKITIKNLKNSAVYESAIKEVEDKAREKLAKFEEGELTESENDEYDSDGNFISDLPASKYNKDRKRKKHSHSDKDEKSKHEDSKRSKSDKDRDRHKSSQSSNSRDHRDYSSSRKSDHHYSSRHSHSSYRDSSSRYERYRDRDDKHRSQSGSGSGSGSRSRNISRSRYSRDRYIHHSDNRRRSKSPSSSIDKKKLLEIARKNAINMLKSGTLPDALTLGPQAQEKVIAAIKAGGKTVEELTDFCKNLSQKEAMGELSSVSSNDDDDSNSEIEKVFHHPFQIKDKPTSIIMNIKNSVPLPVNTVKEKSAELRLQFPVSSGQLHRKTESEWVPVSPKPTPAPTPAPAPSVTALVPVVPTPPTVPKTPTVTEIVPPLPSSAKNVNIPLPQTQNEMDISTIVSQRLHAMRKLQENPNDVQALGQMYRVQREMENWAQSKQQPGQFTGTTGAQILSAAELSSGYQAWARKDQLQNAAPVTGGMGMHLLQKMGWKPGEGLGKEKTGSLEPLLLEVKLDKKGLVANEEGKNKRVPKSMKTNATVKTLAGKHPVSLLGEYSTKRKLGAPQYNLCFECGPDHKKNFLYKVILNGVEYKPNVASSTKKQAKSDAATVCLQQLGLLLS